MSLEINKTEGILKQNASTPATGAVASSDASTISFKYTGSNTIDKRTEKEIRAMLYIINPKIRWDELEPAEQKKYIEEYANGTLQKKCAEIKKGSENALKSLSGTLSAEEAMNAVVDSHMSRIYDNYNELAPEAKKEAQIKEGLRILEYLYPETSKLSKEEKLQKLGELQFTIAAALHHCKKEGIDPFSLTKADFEKFASDPVLQENIRFEFEKDLIAKNPSILEGSNVADAFIAHDYKTSVLNRAVAEDAGIDLNKFLKNETDTNELTLKYLLKKSKTEKLDDFELAKLEELRAQNKKFGNLRGVKDGNNCANFEKNFIYQYFKNENNGEKIKLHHLTDEQRINVQNAIIDKIKSYESKEEQLAFIKENYINTKGGCIRNIYEGAYAQLINEGIITPEELQQIQKEIPNGPTFHKTYEHAGLLKTADLQCRAHKAYVNDKNVNDEQVAAGTLNIAAETFLEEAKAPAVKMSIDRAPTQMVETLPAINQKLNDESSKEVTQYVAKSEVYTAEQKAQIFRDIIDTTKDADMKKFYEDLAASNNIDYNSVPPKAERAKTEKAADKAEENVTNTNYTEQELTEILNSSAQPQNFFMTALNGARETLEIILGKTPDTNTVKAEVQKIDSINTAISELKSGAKLTEVFKGSTLSVQKDLVGLICSYGKIAIGQLIDAFGGETIYKMAKNKNHKELIKKEIERIALSDSTQRVALAEIKKQEAKQGFMSRA